VTEHVFAPVQAPPPAPVADEQLLASKAVRAWVGNVTEMRLYRWRIDPDVGFPSPTATIGNRHYWAAGSIRQWLKTRQGVAFLTPNSPPPNTANRPAAIRSGR
jgi:hypothetical protein